MQPPRFCLQRVCDDATLNRLRNGVGPPRHRVYILPTPRRRCRRHCAALAFATSLRRVRNAEQAARKRQLQPAQDRRQAEAAARKKDADEIYAVGRSRAMKRAMRDVRRVYKKLSRQVMRRGRNKVQGTVVAVALRAIKAPLDSRQTQLYGELVRDKQSRARAPEKPNILYLMAGAPAHSLLTVLIDTHPTPSEHSDKQTSSTQCLQ